jgi:uncharacterized protein HemX
MTLETSSGALLSAGPAESSVGEKTNMELDVKEENAFRRLTLFVLVVALLLQFGTAVKAFQVAIKQSAEHRTEMQKWQEEQDQEITKNGLRLEELDKRMARMEEALEQSRKEHQAEMERQIRVETIVLESQTMARGMMVGVGVLVLAEILKLVGVSWMKKR